MNDRIHALKDSAHKAFLFTFIHYYFPTFNNNIKNSSCDRKPTASDDVDPDDFGPPAFLQLFTNSPNIDFGDVEGGAQPPVGKFDLKLDEDKNTYEKVTLAGPKYQRLDSLQIFVSEAFEGKEFSFINYLSLTGTKAVDYHNQYK